MRVPSPAVHLVRARRVVSPGVTRLLLAASLAGLGGCGAGAPTTSGPAATPSSLPPGETTTPQKEAAPAAARPRPDVLYPAADAIPPPSSDCPSAGALPEAQSCDTPHEHLAAAMAAEGDQRDSLLAELEECDNFVSGAIRALRAEFAPLCADELVVSVVGEDVGEGAELASELRHQLVALGLGARLRRTALDPPAPPLERERARLEAYFARTLFPWISSQAKAIYAMAAQGAELAGYARGIVAIEAGMADMRFVEIARDVPIPPEIADEPEARDLYYASLDEALEPRKQRGRDAALVGLRDFAEAGILQSERLDAARSLLSRVFGGHRIDSLDALLLPERALPADPSVSARIVARVPPPHAPRLIAVEDPTAIELTSYLKRGLPRAVHQALEARQTTPQTKLLLSRADLEKGIVYFRRGDFQNATRHLADLLDASESQSKAPFSPEQLERARFLRALSLALSAGPKDAAELIARGPRFADALGNLAVLDALATDGGPYAGMAGFDAAYLRELVAPPEDAEYWRDLATRYGKSAALLQGAHREKARGRQQDALATARTIGATGN